MHVIESHVPSPFSLVPFLYSVTGCEGAARQVQGVN